MTLLIVVSARRGRVSLRLDPGRWGAPSVSAPPSTGPPRQSCGERERSSGCTASCSDRRARVRGGPTGTTKPRGDRGASGASRGANDGARTRDRLDHNQELYQLSYVRQAKVRLQGTARRWQPGPGRPRSPARATGPAPAPPGGFEPPTCGLEGRCSIQLSYRGVNPNRTAFRSIAVRHQLRLRPPRCGSVRKIASHQGALIPKPRVSSWKWWRMCSSRNSCPARVRGLWWCRWWWVMS